MSTEAMLTEEEKELKRRVVDFVSSIPRQLLLIWMPKR